MKKLLFIVILFLLFPLTILAKPYNIVDLTVDIDDNDWYVFTRDNIKDNNELDALGITYEYMNTFFLSNSAYLDAVTVVSDNEYLEAFVCIKDVESKYNLHKFSNDDLKELESDFVAKQPNSTDHYIYVTDKYKYVYIMYPDSNLYVIDYYTVINGKGYTIKFQKPTSFSENDKAIIKGMIDNITFKLDSKYEKSTKKFSYMRVIICAIVGGIIGGIGGFIKSKMKKKSSN